MSTKSTADSTEPKVPAFATFLMEVAALTRELPLRVKNQGSFVCLSAPNGHKVYVAKHAKCVTRIDTTLATESTLELQEPNGRIRGQLLCSPEIVAAHLKTLCGAPQIEVPKRGAGRPKQPVVQVDVAAIFESAK